MKDSFELMSKIYDEEVTLLNLGNDEGLVLSKYQNLYDRFKIGPQMVDMSYLDYLRVMIQNLFKQFSTPNVNIGFGLKNLVSSNLLQQIKNQNEAYKFVLETKKYKVDFFWWVNIIDFIIRLVLLATAMILSLPMIQKTSARSGEALLQMSKISQTNITFYMQHYNKLNLFVKSSESSAKTIDRVDQFYTSEFRLKQIKE